jgi:hypothetical protein
MFNTTIDNVGQKRTIRPLYAQHQATPYGGFLDAAWNRSVDIYPGMVMTKLAGENFSLYTGATGQKPFGLSALFVAPKLGIDEVRPTNTNLFTVWVGGQDAVFEILAPAFDTSATWTVPTDGSRKLLGVTLDAHTLGPGLLSPTAASPPTNVSGDAIAELVDVVGTAKILVRLNRFA